MVLKGCIPVFVLTTLSSGLLVLQLLQNDESFLSNMKCLLRGNISPIFCSTFVFKVTHYPIKIFVNTHFEKNKTLVYFRKNLIPTVIKIIFTIYFTRIASPTTSKQSKFSIWNLSRILTYRKAFAIKTPPHRWARLVAYYAEEADEKIVKIIQSMES